MNMFEKIKLFAARLQRSDDSLSKRVIHGGVWMFILRLANRSIVLIRTIVLARLLAPNDFGLFGIAMLSLTSIEALTNIGFDRALIHRKGDIKNLLSTAWTVQVIRGLLLSLALFFGAPLVGRFFQEPSVEIIIKVLGSAVFIKSLQNIGVVYFQKELNFQNQFIYESIGIVVELSVAVSIALISHNVWALVFAYLARNITQTIVSYLIHKFRPTINLSISNSKTLINFGRWIWGTSVLVFLATQGDDIILGKVLGTTALGLYLMAFQISNIATTDISHVISKVAFPLYSKLQDEINKLKNVYKEVFHIIMTFTLPITVGIFLVLPDFAYIFLGNKWLAMIPAARILVWAGLIRSITVIGGTLFQAVGKPRLDFQMNFFRVMFIAITIYPLIINFDLIGVSIAVLIGILGTVPVLIYRTKEITNISYLGLLKDLLPVIGGVSIMGLSVILIQSLIPQGLFRFCIAIIIGSFIYVSYLWLSWKLFRSGPIKGVRILIDSI